MTSTATQRSYMDEIILTLENADQDNIEQSISSVVDLCWEIKKLDHEGHNKNLETCPVSLHKTRQTFSFLECQVEKKKAFELCQSGSGIDQYFFCSDYKNLIHLEWSLLIKNAAKLSYTTPDARCAFLGSGAIPISAIILSDYLSKPVACIDTDAQANAMARAFLEKEQLCHKVETHDSLAEEFDYTGFDLAVIASLIKPKDKVLRKLADDNVSSILIRTVDSAFSPIYEPVDEDMLEAHGYSIIDASNKSEGCMHRTILATKL